MIFLNVLLAIILYQRVAALAVENRNFVRRRKEKSHYLLLNQITYPVFIKCLKPEKNKL